MRKYIPEYYKEFQCLASQCKDTCCAGWEIMIDRASLERYEKVSGNFRDTLKKGIAYTDGEASFHMDSYGRCAFLNEKNLCEIYINLGQDALCQICTEHPRFHGQYGTILQSGVGLACEAAASLILNPDRPFMLEEPIEESDEFEEDEWADWLFLVQERLFEILKNRQYSIKERMSQVLSFTYLLQQCVNQEQELPKDIKKIQVKESDIFNNLSAPKSLKNWLYFYMDLEYMDPVWTEMLTEIVKEKIYRTSGTMDHVYYENLTIYFIYRHFMKASEDYNLFDKVRFAVSSCLLLDMLNRLCMKKDFPFTSFDIARMYSKEIEYSEENLSAIFEEFLFDPPCQNI